MHSASSASPTTTTLSAADRRLLTDRLIAAVLWHRDFEARGWPDAAQNEIDEAHRLASELEAGR